MSISDGLPQLSRNRSFMGAYKHLRVRVIEFRRVTGICASYCPFVVQILQVRLVNADEAVVNKACINRTA